MRQEEPGPIANNQMMSLTTGPYPLFAILLLAALLRVWGLSWGLPSATHYFSYHPDESRVLQVAMFSMNLFAGKLLPHFYNYGSLQISLVNFANSLVFLFGGVDIVPKDFPAWYPQWARMYLIGRSLTVLMGVGTVWATYALGNRLWGRRAGLVAALILAITPLHAQHSHWLTVDVPATFWVMLSLLWTAKMAFPAPATGAMHWRVALWAGVFAGLAAATKYNMALVLLPLIAGGILAPPKLGVGGAFSRFKPLAVGLAASLVAFLIACPGAVLETGQFLADLRFEAVHVNNVDDPTFKDTGSGFVYHITHNLDAGLGLPLLLLTLVSVLYAAVRRERGDGLLAAFALPYYIVISLAAVRYARYVIPLLPLLALWSGRLLAVLSRSAQPLRHGAAVTAGAAVLLLTLGSSILLIRPMSSHDPRDRARDWIVAHVPLATNSVDFAALPWFQTPPLDPYFTQPAPGAGWRQYERQSPPLGRVGPLLYAGTDWDYDFVNRVRPAAVVLSEYDYRDALRLHDPRLTAFMTALARNYRPAFVAPPVAWPDHDGGFGLPTHDLPHDMLYTDPEIIIYQRKQ